MKTKNSRQYKTNL